MSDAQAWQQSNDAYLGAALAWLRLRLVRLANRAQPPAPPPVPVEPAGPATAQRPNWLFGVRPAPAAQRPSDTPAAVPLLLPAEVVTDEQIAQAEAEMRAAERAEPPPALLVLAKLLDLSPFERDMLLLCAAMELDTRTARLCAQAQDDPARPYPTFALALALFDDPAWDALSPERPLRFWRLVEIVQPAGQPLTASAVRADERIVNYLKGLNYLDDRLAPLVVPFELPPEGGTLPPSQQALVEQVVRLLRRSDPRRRLPPVQLLGGDTPSKQLLAFHVAALFGRHLHRLPAELMPAQAAELETLARLWQREHMLLPLALYLDPPLGDRATPGAAPLARFLSRSDGLFFVDTPDPQTALGEVAFDVAKPSAAEQRALWTAELGERAGDSPERLAAQFNLGAVAIRQIAQAALAGISDDSALADGLWDACRARLRPKLDTLAQRIDARATWEDIVLPDEALGLLRQIAEQVGRRSTVYEDWGFAARMNRGLGISALFAGDSGTGKTMAAEVIANHLRLDLYRIDLSQVVNKYIGETEKNLRRLFDAVEDGGAILFFDEADALFGKRSEIKDSHDRYANIEVNYLLQRMEAYSGLAILATNMKSALDSAFLRRLRFVVNFPFPSAEQRRHMWRRAFPPDAPLGQLDYDRLARLNLTGGNIHTVAINAAFLAASAGTAVTMPLVLSAARTEFRKLDRVVNEADFQWQGDRTTG
ncbi:MAG: ATP-binding protein [Roseiflexaceae bacterium]